MVVMTESQAAANASVATPESLAHIAVKQASKWIARRVKQVTASAAKSWRKALGGAYHLITTRSRWEIIASFLIVVQGTIQVFQGAAICNSLLWKEAAKTSASTSKLYPLSIFRWALLRL